MTLAITHGQFTLCRPSRRDYHTIGPFSIATGGIGLPGNNGVCQFDQRECRSGGSAWTMNLQPPPDAPTLPNWLSSSRAISRGTPSRESRDISSIAPHAKIRLRKSTIQPIHFFHNCAPSSIVRPSMRAFRARFWTPPGPSSTASDRPAISPCRGLSASSNCSRSWGSAPSGQVFLPSA